MRTFFCFAALLLFVAGAFSQQTESSSQMMNDNAVLNYALTLEHLEATFYNTGQTKFNAIDFQNAGFSASVYAYVDLIRDHENTHVEFLTTVLQSRNASAVQACTYNFGSAFNNVSSYLALARILENTGVMAYDGAANSITDAAYLTAAATIATTEARHAAFLNELNGIFAFSNASFDTPMTPQQIVNITSPFFVSCPAGSSLTSLPMPRDNFVYNYTAGNATSMRRAFKNPIHSRVYETPSAIQNDNNLLNYALTLEQFGYAFYTTAAAMYNQSAFMAAGFNATVYNHFQLIVLHEITHTNFLKSVLQSRGVTPIPPCVYNLNASLASVQSVLSFARVVENLEVTAYDGAIGDITDEGIVQAAATIATIEARHAGYLNYLLESEPIQESAFDSTNGPEQIFNITAPYFVSCPVAPPVPEAYYLFSTNVAPSASAAPSMSVAASSAPRSPSPAPTSPSSAPSYSYSYSSSYSYSGSSSTSSSCSSSCSPPPNQGGRGGTTINFFFADILRGAY